MVGRVGGRERNGCASEDVSEMHSPRRDARRAGDAYRAHLNFRGSAFPPIIDRTTLVNIAPGCRGAPPRALGLPCCRERTTTALFLTDSSFGKILSHEKRLFPLRKAVSSAFFHTK